MANKLTLQQISKTPSPIRVAVLGRGKSLSKYPKFAHLFEKVVFVNPFAREIDMLGREHFEGKQAIHVVSKGSDCRIPKPQQDLFSEFITTANGKLPPGPYQYPNFQLFDMQERGIPTTGSWEAICKMLDDGIELPDIISQLPSTGKRIWPTTGIFAIELALTLYYPVVMFLFGFDCFDRGLNAYLVPRRKAYQTPAALRVMKAYLSKLVAEFDIEFYSADASVLDATPERSNWHSIDDLKSPLGREGASY